MIHGSLFSGIGGFDLAARNIGYQLTYACEIDPAARGVLARHFPGLEVYADVRTAEPKTVDVLTGGFPCQDVSLAGGRSGLAGSRSGLWREFARIIEQSRPRWVVVENVPGLLSSNGGRDFATVITEMVKFGYGVAWRVLDAQYYGLAQQRKRVFIVGSLGSGRAAEVLFERDGSAWDNPPSREAGQGITSAIAPALRANGIGTQCAGDSRGQDALIAFGGNRTSGERETASALNTRGGNRLDFETDTFIANWQSGGGKMDDDRAATLRAGAEHTAQFLWQEARRDGKRIEIQGDVSPTLGAAMAKSGLPLYGLRRLMPVECERLQGFPDGWTAGQSDSARYKQLGNAVAVPVVQWILRRIKEARP